MRAAVLLLHYTHIVRTMLFRRKCVNNKILRARMVGSYLFQSLAILGSLEAFFKPHFKCGCQKRRSRICYPAFQGEPSFRVTLDVYDHDVVSKDVPSTPDSPCDLHRFRRKADLRYIAQYISSLTVWTACCINYCRRPLLLPNDTHTRHCIAWAFDKSSAPLQICPRVIAHHLWSHGTMSPRVRFCRDPVQSLCRPLQHSELKLLRLLEDHMHERSVCYWYLRCFRLSDMCLYCQGLTTYTILRFEGLHGRHLRRTEYECTPTFVEMPRSFKATRLILRMLTEDDIECLDASVRSTFTEKHHVSAGSTIPPSRRPAARRAKAAYLVTYRRSTQLHGPTWCRGEDMYGRAEDISSSFHRLVVTTTRDR